ncbi:hypothetical protein ABIE66_001290 [Peribacillus sp. B2I2]|jgi:hypothetical protein
MKKIKTFEGEKGEKISIEDVAIQDTLRVENQ